MKAMKASTLVCAIALSTLGFSSLSFAQPNDFRYGPQGRQQMQQRGPQHGHGPQAVQNRYVRPGDHRFDHNNLRRNDRGHYYNARGPEFRRGGYIPREFRNRQYVVNNYRAYHLAPPLRGQQWVQVGSDYALIAIATGLIAHLVFN